MTRTTTTSPRTGRILIVFDIAIVLLFALFLWAPWDRIVAATGSSVTMTWLALPVTLARHGVHLEHATIAVTIGALIVAALAALLSIAGRMRGNATLWAVGSFLFGSSVAILMPLWTAVGFLGALLLLVALRARFVALQPVAAFIAFLSELWPVGFAIGFAVLAWRYNPQLLIKALMVAFGISLIVRAMLPPSRADATATANAASLR
jgi:hypothetical protein